MKVTKIKLGLDDVNAFVNAATECDFDIDVNYNRVIIDAKSILGVLGQLSAAVCSRLKLEYNLIICFYTPLFLRTVSERNCLFLTVRNYAEIQMKEAHFCGTMDENEV